MNDSIEARRKAAEEQYFQKEEQAAILRLKAKQEEGKPRLSPITGKAMEQINIQGIVVDRCIDSGGIFLDAGELEQILKTSKEASAGWFDSFLGKLGL